MKRMILAAIAALMIAGSCAAGCLDPLYKEFKKTENVEIVKIPSWMLRLSRWSGGNKDHITRKIKGLNVIAIDKACDPAVRQRFTKRLDELASGLETVMQANEDGDRVEIRAEIEGEKIKTVYIFAIDKDNDMVLTEFKGNFTLSDIESLKKQR